MKVIKADEVKTLPRGRKATFNAELVKVLGQIKNGTFGVLDTEFKSVPVDDRQKVSAEIRKHWAQAHPGTKCQVRWSPDGYAQVGFAKA